MTWTPVVGWMTTLLFSSLFFFSRTWIPLTVRMVVLLPSSSLDSLWILCRRRRLDVSARCPLHVALLSAFSSLLSAQLLNCSTAQLPDCSTTRQLGRSSLSAALLCSPLCSARFSALLAALLCSLLCSVPCSAPLSALLVALLCLLLCSGLLSSLLAADCWLLAADCWLLTADCWLLTSNYWLSDCWSLTADHWLLSALCSLSSVLCSLLLLSATALYCCSLLLLCVLRSLLFARYSLLAARYSQLAARCSLLAALYSLLSALCSSALCSLLSALCSLLSVLCSLLSALCSLLSALCSLLSALCSLLSALCSLLSALCSLLSALCSLLSARCSLLAARYSHLAARCSLLAALGSLLSALCSLLSARESAIFQTAVLMELLVGVTHRSSSLIGSLLLCGSRVLSDSCLRARKPTSDNPFCIELSSTYHPFNLWSSSHRTERKQTWTQNSCSWKLGVVRLFVYFSKWVGVRHIFRSVVVARHPQHDAKHIFNEMFLIWRFVFFCGVRSERKMCSSPMFLIVVETVQTSCWTRELQLLTCCRQSLLLMCTVPVCFGGNLSHVCVGAWWKIVCGTILTQRVFRWPQWFDACWHRCRAHPNWIGDPTLGKRKFCESACCSFVKQKANKTPVLCMAGLSCHELSLLRYRWWGFVCLSGQRRVSPQLHDDNGRRQPHSGLSWSVVPRKLWGPVIFRQSLVVCQQSRATNQVHIDMWIRGTFYEYFELEERVSESFSWWDGVTCPCAQLHVFSQRVTHKFPMTCHEAGRKGVLRAVLPIAHSCGFWLGVFRVTVPPLVPSTPKLVHGPTAVGDFFSSLRPCFTGISSLSACVSAT